MNQLTGLVFVNGGSIAFTDFQNTFSHSNALIYNSIAITVLQ